MEYNIIHLPKEEWKDHIVPIGYTTREYYDVTVEKQKDGFTVSLERKPFEKPVTHTPQEYDFPDKLYQEWWQGACAWGILEEGKPVAVIETAPEIWSNRLRITELWVEEKYQKQGVGHALMEVAKEQARLERRRAILLETQSCNVNAIGFYLHEGFQLIGMDTCCYGNRDLERKEVRLELGWFPERKAKLSREEIEIRKAEPGDRRAVEEMTQRAFWNLYHKGCDEHYLVHKLWTCKDYLPCDHFGITTADGKNFDAFMGIELKPGSLQGIHGAFHEADVFGELLPEDVEKFNAAFPALVKQYFPAQWIRQDR